ncbi:MEDS domain-containing protein [Dactylosporangium sp. CA-139114]|uniref:MEDS domain-containing protein n=1 Tax=Dactylosporangium sp. CA-139114 TaxID=3239931 RepID=UPI003D97F551
MARAVVRRTSSFAFLDDRVRPRSVSDASSAAVVMADTVRVDELQDGDHACLTFTDHDECSDVVAEFVTAGLLRGQKVVCFADASTPDDLALDLALREVDVHGAIERGQLDLRSGQADWLGGEPHAEQMIAALASDLADATARGFRGLRVSADMSWATRPVASAEQLIAFERHCAHLFDGARLTAMCQYDRDRFDPVSLAFVTEAHGRAVAALAYHDTPLLRICRQHRPAGIRIAGELDFTHAEPLEQALAEALRLDSVIHLNLAKLRFIDVASATIVAKAALTLPTDRRMIVTCRPPVAAVFDAIGAGQATQLDLRRQA